jgi:hypothetical protein
MASVNANVNVINAYNTYGVHHHNKVNEQVNNQNAAQNKVQATAVNKNNQAQNQNTQEQQNNQNLQNNPQFTATLLNLYR